MAWMSYGCPVDEDLTLSDCEKPRYLLPEGCKDLNDVIRLREQGAGSETALKKNASESALPVCLTISDFVTVGALAYLLQVKPYRLICALIKFKTFARATSVISFATAAKVCAYYGVAVHKAENL